MQHTYLGAIAFGATLLLASFLLGGKDTDHGGDAHGDVGRAWAPFGSMRFWVFLFAFGGGAGLALTKLGTGTVISGIAAAAIGWLSGAIAVTVVRAMGKNSVSSEVGGAELIGQTGMRASRRAPRPSSSCKKFVAISSSCVSRPRSRFQPRSPSSLT